MFPTERDARTLLAKNLPYKVTQDELKEVFEDAMEIRLVSKDGKSRGYVNVSIEMLTYSKMIVMLLLFLDKFLFEHFLQFCIR